MTDHSSGERLEAATALLRFVSAAVFPGTCLQWLPRRIAVTNH